LRTDIHEISKEVDEGDCSIDDNLDNLEKALWWGTEKKDIWAGDVPVYFYYHVNSGKVFASTRAFTFGDACDIDKFLEGVTASPTEVVVREEVPTKRRLWLVKK
jgi:hypothetical protein